VGQGAMLKARKVSAASHAESKSGISLAVVLHY
jgi:hypothetical protein